MQSLAVAVAAAAAGGGGTTRGDDDDVRRPCAITKARCSITVHFATYCIISTDLHDAEYGTSTVWRMHYIFIIITPYESITHTYMYDVYIIITIKKIHTHITRQ